MCAQNSSSVPSNNSTYTYTEAFICLHLHALKMLAQSSIMALIRCALSVSRLGPVSRYRANTPASIARNTMDGQAGK